MPLTDPALRLSGPRRALLLASLAALLLLAWLVPARDGLGRPLPLSLGFGAMFGLVLQRARFCFWCIWRDWLAERDPRGLIAILVALGLGTLGYTIVFGAWLADPATGRLPPDAHIGPVSLTLVAGALAFGLGMALSGSCVSAHLYRLGEGAYGSLTALAGVLGGFVLGFLSWNSLYLWELYRAPVIWLPGHLGYGGSLAATLVLLAALATYVLRAARPPRTETPPPPLTLWQALFARRWPPVSAGLLIGSLAVLAYFRVGPLGVTAELGSLARTGAMTAGWLPETLQGLDGFAGCATVIKEALMSRNGVFVLGMVLSASAAAVISGDWVPQWPKLRDIPRLFGGGLLLGWGAMVSLGCTVGVLLSGIMAGAAAGWIFAVFCLLGAWVGWRLRGGRRPA